MILHSFKNSICLTAFSARGINEKSLIMRNEDVIAVLFKVIHNKMLHNLLTVRQRVVTDFQSDLQVFI